MFQKLLIIVASLSIVGTVHAQQRRARPTPAPTAPVVSPTYSTAEKTVIRSEYFHQPEAGVSALSLAGGYADGKAKAKTVGAVEQTVNGYMLGAEYLYGVNEILALGGSFNFGSLESGGTTKTKRSGMGDPKLVLKGTSYLGAARLRFGTEFDISIEKMKVDSNGRQTNIASGGMSLAPYVGFDANVGSSGNLGARLTYTINFDRKVEVPGASSDATITDGNELEVAAFYEHFIDDMVLGGAFNYKSYETSKVKNGGNYSEAFNTKGISLFSRIPVGGLSLVPKFDYDFDHSEADTYNIMTFTLIARMNF